MSLKRLWELKVKPEPLTATEKIQLADLSGMTVGSFNDYHWSIYYNLKLRNDYHKYYIDKTSNGEYRDFSDSKEEF